MRQRRLPRPLSRRLSVPGTLRFRGYPNPAKGAVSCLPQAQPALQKNGHMERLQKESAAACSKTGLHNENRPQKEQFRFLLRSIFCVLSFGGGCFAAVPFILCENLRRGRPHFFGTDRFSGSNRPSAAARVQAEQLQALRTAGEDFHAPFPGLHIEIVVREQQVVVFVPDGHASGV